MKQCTRCRIVKPLVCFPRHAGRADGYYSSCSTCKTAAYLLRAEAEKKRRRERYQENAVRERAANHRWQNENREAVRAACRWWRSANPEAAAEATRDWFRRNPGKRRAYQMKRHAAKLQRTPKWLTPGDWAQIETVYRVAAIMTWLEREQFEVDHIVPLQGENVSGLHVPWNLQILTERDNILKGNRWT